MTDALEMFRAMRPDMPPVDGNGGDIRVPASKGSRDLHNLAMVPGSPGYRARIPLPPCFRCGEDHVPTMSYDHAWEAEPVQAIHDEPVSATAISRRPTIVEQYAEPAGARRLALYVGRGDTYVVAIEEPPDWDSVQSFKVAPEQVLPLVNIARALGAKVADKTGGDLFMLEEEASASQHAQAHDRGAAAYGGGEPRRPGPAADGPEEDQPEAPEIQDGDVPGRSNQRRHSARRQER